MSCAQYWTMVSFGLAKSSKCLTNTWITAAQKLISQRCFVTSEEVEKHGISQVRTGGFNFQRARLLIHVKIAFAREFMAASSTVSTKSSVMDWTHSASRCLQSVASSNQPFHGVTCPLPNAHFGRYWLVCGCSPHSCRLSIHLGRKQVTSSGLVIWRTSVYSRLLLTVCFIPSIL